MSLLDSKLWLLGVSFHAYTFIVLLFTLVVDVYFQVRQGLWVPDAVIHGAAATTLAIHFYETLHGLFELYFMGFLTPSVYLLNIPVGLLSLFIILKSNRGKYRGDMVVLPFICVMWFLYLGKTGFYEGYTKNWVWAVSKFAVSATVLSLFTWRDNPGT